MSNEFLVALVFAVVILVAFTVQPRKYFGHWNRLAIDFQTDRVPDNFTFKDQRIYVGHMTQPRFFWFIWQRRSWQMDCGEYALFDAECTSEGLWLYHKGENPAKCPKIMLIPWNYIRVRVQYENQTVFEVASAYGVDFRISGHLRDTCNTYVEAARLDAVT